MSLFRSGATAADLLAARGCHRCRHGPVPAWNGCRIAFPVVAPLPANGVCRKHEFPSGEQEAAWQAAFDAVRLRELGAPDWRDLAVPREPAQPRPAADGEPTQMELFG